MAAVRKVIITCAVTGSVHTPTMTPYLPITPDQIARESIEAAEAGAAVIHLHARDPKDGRPTPIRTCSCSSCRGSSRTPTRSSTSPPAARSACRWRTAWRRRCVAKPELCSLNMGSMNFGLYHVAEKFNDWKHPWEKAYLEKTKDLIVSNTFAQIERFIRDLGEAAGPASNASATTSATSTHWRISSTAS